MVGKGCMYSGQRYFEDTDVIMYVCYRPDPDFPDEEFVFIGDREPYYCLEAPERCPWHKNCTIHTEEACECC